MLITMGQQEETPVLKEANLHEDDQVIASTDVKGKAYFGLGILNPIEHKIIAITNNNKDNNANANTRSMLHEFKRCFLKKRIVA